jgi:hypothetical protein
MEQHVHNKELAMNMIAASLAFHGFPALLCWDCEQKRGPVDGLTGRFHGYVYVIVAAVLQNVSRPLAGLRPAAVRRCLEDSGNKDWFGKPRADAKTERELGSSPCVHVVDDLLLLLLLLAWKPTNPPHTESRVASRKLLLLALFAGAGAVRVPGFAIAIPTPTLSV